MFKKNDLVTLTIEDMSTEGEGIGKVDGFTLFVKDAFIGEEVEAKILKCKKHYGFARLERILKESSYRVEPACPHHRRCGGCQLQALAYEKQLAFKDNKIRNNLMRIGGFSPELIADCMEPIIGMENPYRYRNKAQFPFGKDKDGNIITGFYAARTHTIIPNLDCLLGVEENQEILEMILSVMKEKGIAPYDEKTGKGLIRHVLIRKGFVTGELMVCFVINGKKLPYAQAFIDKLCKLKNMTSIWENYNTKNTNVILGTEGKTLWGKEYITDYIGDISFHISPLSFYQVNPKQTKKLYDVALSYASLTGKETVWDLYCGIGTISLFLARQAKQVYGVEIVPEAIADAKDNAARNNITNATFFVGKAEEVVPAFYEGNRNTASVAGETNADMCHPDVIVVDPPRKGCDETLLATMLEMSPDRIVYVSCDSATLARDLRILCDGGYELKKVRGVDQFGMGVHVECVTLLQKIVK